MTEEQPADIQRILEERAKHLVLSVAQEKNESEVLRLVTFLLGQERYGVVITSVKEIQPLQSVTLSRVPCTPDFIVGAVNIRGRIYPVMDIACFLDLPVRPISETPHVLLVEAVGPEGEEKIELCILTDEIPQTVSVSPSEVQPPSTTVSKGFVRGITGDMLVILDLEHLLSDPRFVVHEGG